MGPEGDTGVMGSAGAIGLEGRQGVLGKPGAPVRDARDKRSSFPSRPAAYHASLATCMTSAYDMRDLSLARDLRVSRVLLCTIICAYHVCPATVASVMSASRDDALRAGPGSVPPTHTMAIAQGKTGSPGEPGATGFAGATGSAGVRGGSGRAGDPGLGGAPGIDRVGLPGSEGAQGPPGGVGRRGPPGPEGSEGLQGNIGIRGKWGYPGMQGLVGEVQGQMWDPRVWNEAGPESPRTVGRRDGGGGWNEYAGAPANQARRGPRRVGQALRAVQGGESLYPEGSPRVTRPKAKAAKRLSDQEWWEQQQAKLKARKAKELARGGVGCANGLSVNDLENDSLYVACNSMADDSVCVVCLSVSVCLSACLPVCLSACLCVCPREVVVVECVHCKRMRTPGGCVSITLSHTRARRASS